MNRINNASAQKPSDLLPQNPHSKSASYLAEVLDVSLSDGLTAEDVKKRQHRFGLNALLQHQPISAFAITLNQFKNPVMYLLCTAALLAIVLGEWINATAIGVVLLINAIIGFMMEIRALRSMESLRKLSEHSARVRRNGQTRIVPAHDIVPGDIIILDAGDIIAADLRVTQSASLASDESVLTGESLPVSKTVDPVAPETQLAERTSMLYKGCAITRGTGEGLVTTTGMQTEFGKIAGLVAKSQPERSPLESQLKRLSRDLIWLTLGITFVLAVFGIFAGQPVRLMIETSVALAVAAIPEGLPIVATLALARGMLTMARHNALIDRLAAVETLGSTTVILTDKTGTLTENRMHVDTVVTATGEIEFDRLGARFLIEGRKMPVLPGSALYDLLLAAGLCNNAALNEDGNGGTGDPMEVALLEAVIATGLSPKQLAVRYPELAEHAFDVSTRMMATVHRDSNGFFVAVKGAPEAVFTKVETLQTPDGLVEFDVRMARKWLGYCDALAGQGLRLLAVAGKTIATADIAPYAHLTLYGLVCLQDPPRPDIAGALAETRRAGVKVVMVTGDHIQTAKSIAHSVGLSPEKPDVIQGADLRPLDEMGEAEKQSLRQVTVFSRVTPAQKLDLIRLHQSADEIVAMTGDGVNDAPALKQADIGIAMGQRGTQVAREAADIVLRDDAFSTIIHAIRQGRIIYTNIRRFSTYLLSCNLSEILVIGLATLSTLPLPLLPLQILFLNLVTDVFPALALGTIEAGHDVLQRPPRDPAEPILTKRQWQAIIIHGGTISTVTLSALVLAMFWFELARDQVTTMCFFTLALAQLWHVFNMRNWRNGPVSNQLTKNIFIWLAIAICIVILLVAALEPHLAGVLHLVALPSSAWISLLLLSVVPVLTRELAAVFVRNRRRKKRGGLRRLRQKSANSSHQST